jgi:hypothetical protein
LWFHSRFCEESAGDFHDSQRRGIYADEVGNPGFWRWPFRIGGLVRSGKTEAGLPCWRRVESRIDRELKHAERH